MSRRRFQAKAKSSRKKPGTGIVWSAVLWVVGLFAGVWLTWVVLFPSHSGWLGSLAAGGLFQLLGGGAYLVPVLAAWGLALYFMPKRAFSWVVLGLGAVSSLVSLASLLSHLDRSVGKPADWGGLVGSAFSELLIRVVGHPGAVLAELGLLALGLQLYFEVPWKQVALQLAAAIREDTASWMEARRNLEQVSKKAKADGPVVKIPVASREPAASEPVLVTNGYSNGAESPDKKPKQEKKAKEGKTDEAATSKKAVAPPPSAGPFELPSLELLKAGDASSASGRPSDDQISQAASTLERTLANFGIEAKVMGANPGPVITRYELSPAPGVKVSSIVNLSNDLALALKAKSIRIIAPIPGKAAVGIEIPNPAPASVTLREILETSAYQGRHRLPFCLGRKADGEPIVADIASMPHLLIAGATGSGKSVLIHDLIQSLLYRMRPDQLKFVLIDPKRLELTFYEGIPHLYDPRVNDYDAHVLTDPKEASKSIKKLVRLMEIRYERFAKYGVRNIDGYNEEADKRKEPREFYVVVVIDELADLILTSGELVEDSVQRLAQMARAVGIHLVLCTQRPSVDVLTGVIKANIPVRVALQVISKVDSRVILDSIGADSLLGNGDLLYLAPGTQKPVRCQAPYVSEAEIRAVADHLRAQGKPTYPPMEPPELTVGLSDDGKGANVHELIAAMKLVMERRRVSQDLLKAHFGSSAKATDLLSVLEMRGFISKPEGTNRWDISYDRIEEYLKAVRPPGSENN
jgi:S-DNA-T family DNA segregation ATPase FtsK/SpoIIIE